MKRTLLLISLLFVSFMAMADNNDRFSLYTKLLSPEKLYIHTDREVYCVGDTIWFKGYLNNASAVSEFGSSNYIYVELISAMAEKNISNNKSEDREAVRERVKVKRIEDYLLGYLKVPENLNTGIATLRAYSYWMLNGEPEYMFYKNLEIRNPMKDDVVKQMEEQGVREESKYIDLGMENPYTKKRAVKHDVDVQFLPESGRYVAGTMAKFGVKAVGEDGLGSEITGKIVADGTTVSEFSTDRYGMAVVYASIPAGTKQVTAEVSDTLGLSKKIKIQAPDQNAVVISLTAAGTSAEATISRYGINLPDSTFIVIHDGTEMYMKMPYTVKNSRLKIPYQYLSAGINNLAVLDSEGNVYASRAFFVYPSESWTSTITPNKEEYGPREKVICSAQAPEGDYSISVSDDSYAPYSGKGYNIVSHWYLGSELLSFVENSQRLFDTSRSQGERISDMDRVMLTHGWRYYDLPKICKGESMMPQFGREYKQSISGVVKTSFSKAKKAMVSFVAPSIGYTALGQLDTTGYFALNDLDFPEGTKFLVAAMSLGGSTRRYMPYLDKDIFAKFHKYPTYLNDAKYDDLYKFDAMGDFYMSGGEMVFTLNPSYVTGARVRRETNITPFPDFDFKQGQYRTEEELAPYAAYDVMTYIISTCPPLRYGDMVVSVDGDTTDTQTGARTIMCRTQKVSSEFSQTSGWEEIIVFVNGMRSSCADLDGLNVSDIEGFAYIKGSDAAPFQLSVDNALAPRSVIMVKTKMIVHDSARNVDENIPLGWQRPKLYYNPRYETGLSKRQKEKMRSTLYWEPVATSVGGKIDFDFYTSDHKVPYTIIIEGMTKEGKPYFSKQKIYR